MRRAGIAGSAVVLALASMALAGYRFGVEDQAQYLVEFLHARTGAFAGDPYLEAFGGVGSLFWRGLALVCGEEQLASAALGLHGALTVINALLLAWVAYMGGARGVPAVLLGAALLAVPKELNWFGLVALSDRELTATFCGLTIGLASMALWVRGWVWWSLAAATALVPIQGQTAAFVLSTWWVATALDRRARRSERVLLVLIGGVGLAGVVLAQRHFARMDTAWGEIRQVGLGLYPELVNPLLAPRGAWVATLGLIGLGAVCAWRLGMAGFSRKGEGDEGAAHEAVRRLCVYGAASLAYPLAGIALHAAGVEDGLLWRLMIGRSLGTAQVVALVLLAMWCVRARGRWQGVGSVLCAVLVAWWPVSLIEGSAEGGVARLGLAGLGAFVGACVLLGGWRWEAGGRAGGVAGVLGIVVATGLGAWAFGHRSYPWLASGEEGAWLEVQRWAREHTAMDAVFITPPYRSGWRVGSHRQSFGEMKDGALLFYGGDASVAWRERMDMLGMEGLWCFQEVYGFAGSGRRPKAEELMGRYEGALERLGSARLGEMGDFVVTESGRAFGDAVWTNGSFWIWQTRKHTP